MALGVIPFLLTTVVMYVAFTAYTSTIFEALNLLLHVFYVIHFQGNTLIEHTLIIVDQNV